MVLEPLVRVVRRCRWPPPPVGAPGRFLDKKWMNVGRSGTADVVWLTYSDIPAEGLEEVKLRAHPSRLRGGSRHPERRGAQLEQLPHLHVPEERRRHRQRATADLRHLGRLPGPRPSLRAGAGQAELVGRPRTQLAQPDGRVAAGAHLLPHDRGRPDANRLVLAYFTTRFGP